MTFQEAGQTALPFGKYLGKTLFEVLETDPRYIDSLCNAQLTGKFREAYGFFIESDDVQSKVDRGIHRTKWTGWVPSVFKSF
jgi:hypothetical protein